MAPQARDGWRQIGRVRLRNEYYVERRADVFRVRSSTPKGADFGQEVEGSVVRFLAEKLEGQTVTVAEAEDALRKSGLRLPYSYGHKLHFYAQSVLLTLVASCQASASKAGRHYEYHIA